MTTGRSRSGDPDEDIQNLLSGLDDARRDDDTAEISCRYRAASGETVTGRWRGVRVATLLADTDPEATHLRAVATDGYCVYVPVRDALEAVVATDRLDGEARGLPRLVGRSMEGPSTIPDLALLETVSLPTGSAPEPRYVAEVTCP